MAQQQPVARKQKRSKRDEGQDAANGASPNGHEQELEKFEHELAEYLQQRIKPGLNRGAIPLLARSIAKEVAHWEPPEDTSAEDDEPDAQADDDVEGEADEDVDAEADEDVDAEADEDVDAEADEDFDEESEDEPNAEAEDEDEDEDEEEDAEAGGDEVSDFEADMRDLQAEFGEDWILRFSVQGDAAWLTAEKEDGSQRLEAPTAMVLSKAVKLLSRSGGRFS